MMSSRLRVVCAAGLLILLAACTATQVATATELAAPNFLFGLWHGFIAPITFIVSLFSETVRVYAVPNTGMGYDFGFMLGISGFSGGVFGGGRSAGKERKRKGTG
jgi:hypothetical protein